MSAVPVATGAPDAEAVRVGIISDTHGLLRPEALLRLHGVQHVLHAGDVGDPHILIELRVIAPVTAVWGNTDGFDVRALVPEVAELEIAGVPIVVVHGQQFGSPTPAALAAAHPHARLVVFGHTHRPLVERVGETLVVNPGSAGPRRFQLPVTVAVATLQAGEATARLVPLLDGPLPSP
jgi:uncharacterized protein